MKLTPNERDVIVVKAILYDQRPFIGALASYVKTSFDETIPTACAEGNNKIIIGPNFWDALGKLEQKIWLFTHELFHLAFEHNERMAKKTGVPRNGRDWTLEDKQKWDVGNIATDLFIEALQKVNNLYSPPTPESLEAAFGQKITFVTKEGIEKALGCEIPDPLKVTVEEMYDFLQQHKKKLEGWVTQKQIVIDLVPDFGDGPKREGDAERVNWGEAMKRAVISIEAGKTPEGLSREISWGESYYDWRELTALAVRRSLPDARERTYTRPSRRASFSKFLTKGRKKKDGLPMTYLFIDTSGSISTETLAFVRAFVRDCNTKLRIFYFDWNLYEEVENVTPENMAFTGGGGTNILPAYEKMEMDRPDLSIVITDGYVSEWPKRTPYKDIIFLVTPGGNIPDAVDAIVKIKINNQGEKV